ncbi:PLP-dependent aminotransferase family protein [Shewanella baltica]|uniref:aminotransferase-like domain-containing protein n=1 Tax=Shewanella baltica TaxID=62322 RepID=UPI002871AA27|nr:PLP-dependent aminotransferase family protein [Shewanella baltica]MDR9767882.1 PLP-dependent aminotransferase family protein [Shewanella baltica]
MYIYQSLAKSISDAIYKGQLPQGAKLPSIRDFSSQHNVSINSVKMAYRQLEDRGFIYARPQAGYFVASRIPALTQSKPIENHQSLNVPHSNIERMLSTILEYQHSDGYIDLALACPEGERFYPSARLRKLTAQTLRNLRHTQSQYALPPGSHRLRSQIARRGLSLGMVLSAKDILITHGAMEALTLAVRATTQVGDRVAIETPTFYNLYPMLDELNREIVHIPTHPDTGMCLKSLKTEIENKPIKAVITVPSGHNPLGFSMPSTYREELVELAHSQHFAIIEDAIYAELQYDDHLIPNMKAFDRDGWVITCGSFTKTIAPDFRIGWMEAGRFKDKIRQLKFTSTVSESVLLTETLGLFLENGSYDLHMRYLKRLYHAQIETVRACIAEHFPAGTRVSLPQCGFILWIELPEYFDSLTFFHRALDEKILCMPGPLCSGNKQFNHCLRLAVCFELDERRLAGIAKLGQLICRSLAP